VRRGASPVRLARLHLTPFTDRLVTKFGLPVTGWRGRVRQPAVPPADPPPRCDGGGPDPADPGGPGTADPGAADPGTGR
jgi:NAD+ kinase